MPFAPVPVKRPVDQVRLSILDAIEEPLSAVVDELYLVTLSRQPRPEERDKALSWIAKAPTPKEGAQDLLWSLLNSREFLFDH